MILVIFGATVLGIVLVGLASFVDCLSTVHSSRHVLPYKLGLDGEGEEQGKGRSTGKGGGGGAAAAAQEDHAYLHPCMHTLEHTYTQVGGGIHFCAYIHPHIHKCVCVDTFVRTRWR